MEFKYDVEKKTFRELYGKIEVPKYQRQLVWSENDKKKFVDTLFKGYPFGSILIYKHHDSEKFSLIDGLQRYSTIIDYKNNRNKYVELEDFTKMFKLEFGDEIGEMTEKQINGILVKYLGKNDFDMLDSTDLIGTIEEKFPDVAKKIQSSKLKKIGEFNKKLKKKINRDLNIDDINIPVITFKGEESELARVFELLNMGGKKLSKYQVFAAQWSRIEIKLNDSANNISILDEVNDWYEKLLESREDIEITGYDREEFLEAKTINLAEFCYAIGQKVITNMPAFYSKPSSDDANEIGYSLITAFMEVKNTKMATLIEKSEKLKLLNNSIFLDDLIGKIVEISIELNNIFANLFKVPGTGDKYISDAKQFQVLAYLISIWKTKYKIDFKNEMIEKLQTTGKADTPFTRIKKYLPAYYYYEIASSKWSNSGDKNFDDIVFSENIQYIDPIDKTRLKNALIDWNITQTNKASVKWVSLATTFLLVYTYYSDLKYRDNTYEVEHIIARKYLTNRSFYKKNNIAGGSLGNMCYLDSKKNKSKGEKYLHEVLVDDSPSDQKLLSEIDYPDKDTLLKIRGILEREEHENAEIVKTVINNRSEKMIEKIVDGLTKY